jgi:hypothetical protein
VAETITGSTTSGTWARSNAASTRYYTASKKWQYIGVPAATYQSFIYTNMPADLAGRQVVSAVLQVYMIAGSGSRTVTVQRHAKPSTSYAAMTYSNRPGVLSGSTAVSTTQDAATILWEFDVTDEVQKVAQGGGFYGWRITSSHAAQWGMYGWGTTRAPKLVVTLADELDAPTDLAPDGVVSLADPVFTWTGPASLSSAQMQIDVVDGDFSAPVWDSGEVATTIGQFDPVAEGFTGWADGDEFSVRVRHTVDAGTTDWSLPVTVTRRALGAVAITSPTGTTEDPTPPIVHTFAGTQSRWQAFVSLNGKVIDDSGVVPGTDLSHTPAKGATEAGQELKITVRAWDEYARTPSPGDPGYAEATITTTYTPSLVLAPVDALSATQVGVRPWVDLNWARAFGAPDEWLIVREGVIIDRIDGTDDAGMVATYRDWTCPPNTDVTYQVFPISAGVTGGTGPVAPLRTRVTGAWVIDTAAEVWFTITGDQLSLGFAEATAVYEPIGGSAPIKRTFALRGLEGTVAGTLDDFDGRTMMEQQADLFAIKGSPAGTYRLVLGDINIPVTVSDLTTVVDPGSAQVHHIRKSVQFTARQVGELPFLAVGP